MTPKKPHSTLNDLFKEVYDGNLLELFKPSSIKCPTCSKGLTAVSFDGNTQCWTTNCEKHGRILYTRGKTILDKNFNYNNDLKKLL